MYVYVHKYLYMYVYVLSQRKHLVKILIVTPSKIPLKNCIKNCTLKVTLIDKTGENMAKFCKNFNAFSSSNP